MSGSSPAASITSCKHRGAFRIVRCAAAGEHQLAVHVFLHQLVSLRSRPQGP